MSTALDRLYCADVTKLLAADSMLALDDIRDPEADSAFSTLVALLANPTQTWFLSRPNLPIDELGSVGRTWFGCAQQVLPTLPSAQDIVMNPERAISFLTAYAGNEAIRAINWVRFQASSSRLMNIFWSDNDEWELWEPYDFLISHQACLHELRSAISEIGETGLLDASRRALAERGESLEHDWTDESLTIGFLGHHYVKAFRYAHTLADRYTYAVHFTREHVLGLAPTPSLNSKRLWGLFPWGDLIMPVGVNERMILGGGFKDIVIGLRSYTEGTSRNYFIELDKIQRRFTIPKERGEAIRQAQTLTNEFAISGLAEVFGSQSKSQIETWWERFKYAGTILEILCCGLVFTQQPFLIPFVGLYIETVRRASGINPLAEAERGVTFVRSRCRAKGAVNRNHKALEAFLTSQDVGIRTTDE